jgi:hypothetical protein
MDAVHRAVGMGPMPRGPLVEYLTRSLSALYVTWAPVLWVLSSDVRRYLPLVRLSAWIRVVLGVGLLVLDIAVGMPLPWILAEGPTVLVLSLVLFALTRVVEREQAV